LLSVSASLARQASFWVSVPAVSLQQALLFLSIPAWFWLASLFFSVSKKQVAAGFPALLQADGSELVL
jgi:hypothetical protein